ncbi:hypothetical protein Cni_G08709 [Canna indica]|uniref:Cellulose synthase-like protein D3 n=1 Tax=Canna indica TaxID=4628 RepID=A0AAQ3Q8N3_9LILI|nr:hypothetical protein Cni_G08709 [Canna indica]
MTSGIALRNQQQAAPSSASSCVKSSGQHLRQSSGGVEDLDKDYAMNNDGVLLPMQSMSNMETKERYGFGSAIWPKDDSDAGTGDDGSGLKSNQCMSLSRKIDLSASVLVPYRLLIFFRIVVLGIYLAWRIKNRNEDAVWLWGMSVICEIWFTFSWLLEQLPKLCPVKRAVELAVLRDKFEAPSPHIPLGYSDLPGIDVFVASADPVKEPPLIMANTVLSILAADYPVEKLACYLSDDAGSLLTFEATAEIASFASVWVPFCRKHDIEPRCPESYFNLKKDPYRNKLRPDFVKDRRRVKTEYDEFKVRINALPDSIRRRSDAYDAIEERKAVQRHRELYGDGDELVERPKIQRATWMANGCHWPGSWIHPFPRHAHGDHSAIIQVMLKSEEKRSSSLDLAGIDIRLPMLVYVAREKRPGYEDNKKAGAMNAMLRASAAISAGPFVLNLDCDNYVHNSGAFREGMCHMMDCGGERVCFVQFPQRFHGVDPSDRYANHNFFFDVNMRALDGIQGPVYLGSGCLFRRMALYGFDPPPSQERHGGRFSCCFRRRAPAMVDSDEERQALSEEEQKILSTYPKRFGNSTSLIDNIPIAEFESRPLADHHKVKYGRLPGSLAVPRRPVTTPMVAEAVSMISCSYEDKTQWGQRVGWVYGSTTEDVVTGYRMHNKGWRSVYSAPTGGRDAFRSTAPINLTDRLQQIRRRATGAVEFFFSKNNAMLVTPGMKALQRLAYLNLSVYPFTSVFLTAYCFLPALCLFSGQFIVQTLSVTFLAYILILTVTLCILAMLEIKWSGIQLVEWWRNEQLWVMGGTSVDLAAVFQGILKGVSGIDLSANDTKKPAAAKGNEKEELDELYMVKRTWLMIPPITIMMVNLVAVAVGVSRTIYSSSPEWSKFLGGLFLSFWVMIHLYPFAKGLVGRRGKTPTVVFVWSGLIAITISLLWAATKSPSGDKEIGGSITFP